MCEQASCAVIFMKNILLPELPYHLLFTIHAVITGRVPEWHQDTPLSQSVSIRTCHLSKYQKKQQSYQIGTSLLPYTDCLFCLYAAQMCYMLLLIHHV